MITWPLPPPPPALLPPLPPPVQGLLLLSPPLKTHPQLGTTPPPPEPMTRQPPQPPPDRRLRWKLQQAPGTPALASRSPQGVALLGARGARGPQVAVPAAAVATRGRATRVATRASSRKVAPRRLSSSGRWRLWRRGWWCYRGCCGAGGSTVWALGPEFCLLRGKVTRGVELDPGKHAWTGSTCGATRCNEAQRPAQLAIGLDAVRWGVRCVLLVLTRAATPLEAREPLFNGMTVGVFVSVSQTRAQRWRVPCLTCCTAGV